MKPGSIKPGDWPWRDADACDHKAVREVAGTGIWECVKCGDVFGREKVTPEWMRGRIVVVEGVAAQPAKDSRMTLDMIRAYRASCEHPWDNIDWSGPEPRCGLCRKILQSEDRKTRCQQCGTSPMHPYCQACFTAASQRADVVARERDAVAEERNELIASEYRLKERLARFDVPRPELADVEERARRIRLTDGT